MSAPSVAIRSLARTGPIKAHRPRNEDGYLHQHDRTSAQTACGLNLRKLVSAPVAIIPPRQRCQRCWGKP